MGKNTVDIFAAVWVLKLRSKVGMVKLGHWANHSSGLIHSLNTSDAIVNGIRSFPSFLTLGSTNRLGRAIITYATYQLLKVFYNLRILSGCTDDLVARGRQAASQAISKICCKSVAGVL